MLFNLIFKSALTIFLVFPHLFFFFITNVMHFYNIHVYIMVFGYIFTKYTATF